MKTPFTFIRSGAVVALILACTLSCHKDNNAGNTGTQTTDDQTAVALEASATSTESLFDDAFDLALQNAPQASTNPTSTGLTTNSLTTDAVNPDCTTVTLSPSDAVTYPKTITVDYGTAGCVNSNITRKGKVVILLSGPIRTAGTTAAITFQNYSVNGYGISGSYNLTAAAGTGGGVNYTVAVANGLISVPGGATFTYTSNETFTQTAGMATTDISDDTYSISGNFNYSGAGVSTAATITTPLVRPNSCAFITSGVIAFTYNSISGKIDFGTGSCDNGATISAGSINSTVTFTGRLNHSNS